MKNLHLLPTDKPKTIIYYCKQNDPYCISPNCRCNTVKIEDHKPVQVMKRQGTTFVSKLEEPKFHVGQRVIVCNTLKTIITKIEDEKYYFLDEIGNVMWDEESSLEPIIEPKQETLEEAAKKEYPICMIPPASGYGKEDVDMNEESRNIFIEGAKWQQKQDSNKYSEEEVLELLNDCRGENPIDVSKWFKQFKK